MEEKQCRFCSRVMNIGDGYEMCSVHDVVVTKDDEPLENYNFCKKEDWED
jgi:hypothetical protein